MAAKNPSNNKTSSAGKSKQSPTNTTRQTNPAKKPDKKKAGKRVAAGFIIMVLVAGVFLASLLYEDKIDEALGFRKIETYSPGEMVAIGGLNLHFIDVGQGDACLVELPDDRVMLIDAGENKTEVKNKLKSYMDEVNKTRESESRKKIEFFDFVIATHSDSDHIGSMAYILGLYPAAYFYRPNEECTADGYTDPALSGANARNRLWGEYGEKDTITYKNALTAGYAPHDNFVEGIIINPAGDDEKQRSITPLPDAAAGLEYQIDFYGPVETGYSDHNNYSPIIIIEYQDRRVALSGDCEKEGEAAFVKAVREASSGSRYYALKAGDFYADIIKLGHHGSRTSSSSDYLNIMSKPQYIENIYIVISYGEGNSYKHPHSEVIERLDALGVKDENVYKTAEDGDIFLAFNFYEGQQRALVEDSRGGPITEVSYPVLGGLVRYRNIGIAVLALLALLLLRAGFIKKAKKKATKNKK